MALLGAYIDQRTLAAIAAEGSFSYAHGLPAAPDFVIVHGSATTTSNVSAYFINALFDATNVTIQNSGEGGTPTLNATAVVAHSVIR